MHVQTRVALGDGEEVDAEDAVGDADVQAAAAEAEAAAAEEEGLEEIPDSENEGGADEDAEEDEQVEGA